MPDTTNVLLVIRFYRVTRSDKRTLVREVPMHHLPEVGDMLEVDRDGDVQMSVVRRHWTFTGQVSLYLNDIFVDPASGTHIYDEEVQWGTAHEGGDPIAILRESGWSEQT